MGDETVITIEYKSIFLEVSFTFYKEPDTGYCELEISSVNHNGECIIPILTDEQIEEIKNLL